MRSSVTALCVFAACVVAVGAAAGAPRPGATLRADVAEWSVVPSTGVVAHGRVRLVVRNLGTTTHQLSLVRTDGFDPRFALSGSRAAIRPLATSPVVRPGHVAAIVVSLAPGSYELVDNLPWHYAHGTAVAFSVR